MINTMDKSKMGYRGYEIKGLQFQVEWPRRLPWSLIYWTCRQRYGGLPRYTSGCRHSFRLLPGPLAAAPRLSQRELSSQTISQKAACIYDWPTWKYKSLTICPQLGQLWRAIAAPCGIAGHLHWNCIMVRLLPLPSLACSPCCRYFWAHSPVSLLHTTLRDLDSLSQEIRPMTKAK